MRDCSLFEVAWLGMISEQLGWVQFEYNMRLMGRVRYLVWSEMRILMGTRNELYGYLDWWLLWISSCCFDRHYLP